MSKVLVIDNYDSFTYNLVHLLEGVDAEVTVVRNDELYDVDFELFPNVLISPGPGIPSDIKQVKKFVLENYQTKNILGVCLGHQLIAECFGSMVELSENVFHGIATPIEVDNDCKLFQNLPESFNVGRYHSWITKEITKDFSALAKTEDGIIMAFQHKIFPLYGIQFHPESILSEYGKEIIENWLK